MLAAIRSARRVCYSESYPISNARSARPKMTADYDFDSDPARARVAVG